MASDAFSDADCARTLNENFVSIKVDREQRPDIDQYLMSFLVATTGSGGWPLNAFLTPDGKPFFAMTYASSRPRFSMPAFTDILSRVHEFYESRREEIRSFDVPAVRSESADPGGEIDFESVLGQVDALFDQDYGGFGTSQKFPPHCTLLFLLYGATALSTPEQGTIRDGFLRMATTTLDAMMERGLHDHLQGGFFRYCVDRTWTIPHFEKMLYDQALLLWSYSLAARVHESSEYAQVATGILTCLEETFRIGDLYAAAHDADTEHHEGATYLWTANHIDTLLDEEERNAFRSAYDITEGGNFEGANHLLRSRAGTSAASSPPLDSESLKRAELKLLAVRRARSQPFRDEKLLTTWNSLLGCGMLAAYRYAGIAAGLEHASRIAAAIAEAVGEDGRVPHDMANTGQSGSFLSDHAAFALLLTMLGEETTEHESTLERVLESMSRFSADGAWFESNNKDFHRIPADSFDSPIPSSSALADAVTLFQRIRGHLDYAERPIPNPLAQGFSALVALVSHGYFHVLERPSPYAWEQLPPNTIQIKGPRLMDCFRGVCYLNLDHLTGRKKSSGER